MHSREGGKIYAHFGETRDVTLHSVILFEN